MPSPYFRQESELKGLCCFERLRLFRDRFERTRVKEYSEHGNRPNKEESRAKGEGQDRRASRGPQTQTGMEFNAFTPSIKIPFFFRDCNSEVSRVGLSLLLSHTRSIHFYGFVLFSVSGPSR